MTFTGFLEDVEKIEAALDIAVITSKAEALCLSILESMIAGIPAVGTDSGGVAEVIRHGENGFLIPVGDSDALAEYLQGTPLEEGALRQALKDWPVEDYFVRMVLDTFVSAMLQ